MRTLLAIGIASLMIPNYGKAQQASTDSGLACFDNLAAPEYPRTALQAHIDGSVWTYIQVSPQGTIDKIDTQIVSAYGEAPKMLTAPVEKAIRAAKVKSACTGKTVTIVFRYQLHGEATANPRVTSRTDAPNIIYVESQPASANTENKAPGKSQ